MPNTTCHICGHEYHQGFRLDQSCKGKTWLDVVANTCPVCKDGAIHPSAGKAIYDLDDMDEPSIRALYEAVVKHWVLIERG